MRSAPRRDRQSLYKCLPHFRSDNEEPVRLAVIGGKLGEEFVVGDAGRSRKLGFGADLCPDFFRNLGRRDDAFEVYGNVEIRFVERQWLEYSGVFGKEVPG